MAELERVANALLEMETLDGEEFEAIYSNTKTVEELQAQDKKKAEEWRKIEEAEAKERAEREAYEAAIAEAREAEESGRRTAIIDERGNVKRIVPGSIRNLTPKKDEEEDIKDAANAAEQGVDAEKDEE